MRRAEVTAVDDGVGVEVVVSVFPVCKLVRVEVREVLCDPVGLCVLVRVVRVVVASPAPLVVCVVPLVVLVVADSLVRVVAVVVPLSCPVVVSVEGVPALVALSLPYNSARRT